MIKLKYIDFIQITTIYILVYLSNVYKYAKENFDPLKIGVQIV